MNYQFLDHSDLKTWFDREQPGRDFVVVDVRDDDFTGGNIPGAMRAPSGERTDQSTSELADRLKEVPKVVFHCSLSQQRGPKAARIYADELARRAHAKGEGEEPDARSAATFAPNPFEHKLGTAQQVFVLRDGFSNWQALYKDDPKLVENYDAKLWQQSY